MLRFISVRSLAALVALGAAAAFSPLIAGSAAASDSLGDVCGYEAPVISTTTLVLESSTVRVGQGTTAHATVSAGDETPEGTVTFAVAGMASQTVALSGGKASYAVTYDLDVGAYQVTAAADLEGCFTPSSDAVVLNVVAPISPTERPTENGDDVVVVDDDDEVAGVARPAAPVSGILPATGVDAGLQTAAMAGFVLLAAGALALLLHRRRKVAAK